MSAALTGVACPYRGLVPFGDSELDAVLFFGRDREREIIVANLMASRLTLLYGPSGVGKSSLLSAGVAHHVRRLAAENVARGEAPQLGVVVFSHWSEEPVRGIIRAAVAEVERLTGEGPELEPDVTLADALDACAHALDGELYVILDQAEEYFVYLDRNGRRDRFAEEFAEAVERRDVRAHFVLSLREDELARLDAFKAAIPGLFGNYLRLDRLDRRAAREAIEGPLREHNRLHAGWAVTIESELVEAVLDQVSVGRLVGVAGGDAAAPADAARIEAPYLQLVMQRIWEAEEEAGSTVLRARTLARLGGADRIVGDHLERALAELSPDEKDAAASMFTYLVTPSGSKIAHAPGDLADYAGVEPGRAHGVLRSLAAQRIVRPVDVPGGDGARYEIFHDVLGDTVLAWRSAYVAERRVAEERATSRRRQRQLLLIAAACLVALAVVASMAVYAWGQRTEARESEQAAVIAKDDADASREETEDERDEADEQRSKAEKQTAVAKKQTKKAQAATALARQKTKEARASEAQAQDSERSAEQSAAAASAAAVRERGLREELEDEQSKTEQLLVSEQEARLRAVGNERRAEREAIRARVAALLDQAIAFLDIDPRRSVKASLEAARSAPGSPTTEDRLRRSLETLRVRAVLRGGGGRIRDVEWSRDGRVVATAADGGEARVFRVGVGRPVHVFRHPPSVRTVALHPAGTLVASGGQDGRVRVWRIADGRSVGIVVHRAAITDVEWALDGSRLITAGADRVVRASTGNGASPVWEHLLPASVTNVEVDPSGRFVLVLAVRQPTARVYRLDDGTEVQRLSHDGELTSAAWSPDGRWVGATGRANARVWEVASWQPRLFRADAFVNTSIAFSHDGARVVTAGLDGRARVWNLGTGALVDVLSGHDHGITDAAFKPGSYEIATASKDDTVRLWLGPTTSDPTLLAGHAQDVTFVSFNPSGTSFVTGSEDGSARVWDARGEPQLTLVDRHAQDVVAVERAGSLVVSAALDGTVHVARLAGARLRRIRSVPAGDEVTAIALSPGGRAFAVGTDNGVVGLWTPAGRRLGGFRVGARVQAIEAAGQAAFAVADARGRVRLVSSSGRVRWSRPAGAEVTSLTVDPVSGRVVAGTARGVLRAWTRRGEPTGARAAHEGAVTTLRASQRGILASGGSDGVVRTWRVVGLRPLQTLRRHESIVRSVRFSPDGRLLASAGEEGDVHIWHVATGRHRRVLSGHVSRVSDVQFSPDGRWLVTAGPGAAGLWDARTARRVAFLRGHSGALRAAIWASDSKTVLTGGLDDTVRSYRCVLCVPVRVLRSMARVTLARLERASTPARLTGP